MITNRTIPQEQIKLLRLLILSKANNKDIQKIVPVHRNTIRNYKKIYDPTGRKKVLNPNKGSHGESGQDLSNNISRDTTKDD